MKAIPKEATVGYNGGYYKVGEAFEISEKDVAHLKKWCNIIGEEKAAPLPTPAEEEREPIRRGRGRKA